MRQIIGGALLLFAVVVLAFAPFTLGDRTLMSSAAEVAGLYGSGGSAVPDAGRVTFKGADPGAAAWQTEPELFLEHHQLVDEHVVPLWNPYAGYGQPLAADMLAQPYFPLTWIVAVHPTARAYNWFIVLRFFCAALCTFLFLRLFVRFIAAIAGGIGFAFTGYLVLYYNIAHLSVEILIPALMWAMELLARRRSPAAVVRLALVVALVMFGGMPESALLAYVFAYLYCIVRVGTDAELRRSWLATGGNLIAASALGIGMSAILLLPFYEFLKLAVNQHDSRFVGNVVGLLSDGSTFHYVAPYLAPLIYGPPWMDVFSSITGLTKIRGWFGMSQVVLALIVVATIVFEFRAVRKRPWSPAPYFIAYAVFSLLKRTGNPLVNWIGALPGLSLVTFPKYEEAVLGFCVACLAAFGVEQIASGKVRAIEVWCATLIPLGILTAVAGAQKAQFLALTDHREFYVWGLSGALIVLAAIATASWISSSARWRVFAPRLALAAVAILTAETLGSYFIPMWYVINAEAPLSRSPINGAPYVTFLQQQTATNRSRFFGKIRSCTPSGRPRSESATSVISTRFMSRNISHF